MKTGSLPALFFPLLGVAVSASLLGCSFSTFDKPMTFSTRPIAGLSDAHPENLDTKSCSRLVLSLIPVGVATSDSAMKEALTHSETLVNVRLHDDLFAAIPFYAQSCVHVEAQTARSGSPGEAPNGAAPPVVASAKP